LHITQSNYFSFPFLQFFCSLSRHYYETVAGFSLKSGRAIFHCFFLNINLASNMHSYEIYCIFTMWVFTTLLFSGNIPEVLLFLSWKSLYSFLSLPTCRSMMKSRTHLTTPALHLYRCPLHHTRTSSWSILPVSRSSHIEDLTTSPIFQTSSKR